MAETVVGSAQAYFYSIAVGIVILLAGFAIGVLARKLLYRVLKEVKLNKIMSNVGITYDLEKAVSLVVSYLIYLVTIVFFLNYLGITSIVLYLLLGGVIMLLVLTLLVGLKDVIPNFVAWLIIQRKAKVKEGAHVNVKEISGVVEKVGYLETEIKTDQGDILYVPNSLFVKTKFWIKKD